MIRTLPLLLAGLIMLNSSVWAQVGQDDSLYSPSGYDDFDSAPVDESRGQGYGDDPSVADAYAREQGRAPAARQPEESAKPSVLSPAQKEKFSRAPIEDITSQNFPETIESFEFPQAELQDVVRAVSELTGKNFIVDPGVRGKITIIAPSKVTVADAYRAFLSALAINGYAVVPSGNFLKIRTARNAQRDGIETYTGNYFPNSDQMVTKVIQLKHISAEQVNRDLRILQSKDGEMSVYPPTNSMIISDYGSNIERITRILKTLDVPGFDDLLEVVQVRYANAKDMAETIMKIINKGETTNPTRGGAFSSGVPRFGGPPSRGEAGVARFTVIPDDRTNSLLISGDQNGIDRVKKLLNQLDRRMEAGEGGGVHVYYVKYGDAEKLAQTLSGVAKDAGPSGGSSTPGIPGLGGPAGASRGPQGSGGDVFGGNIKITADKNTNSLIVVSSKQDFDTVARLLGKIDIRRDQVYMEAIIVEMSGNDATDYQIGFSKFMGDSGVKAGFAGIAESNLANLLSPLGGSGAILPFGDVNNKVTITPMNGGTPIVVPSLLGFINFLKTNGNANVLSNPQILALDAQEASIVVGDKVVVGETATAAGTSGTLIKTPQFEDANLELKVKPFISPEDYNVRMDLEASLKQLSNVRTPAAFVNSAQPLSTRKIKTTIMVHNGDTAVLGGLQREEEQERITKVPLLGDIPILGWLFKSRSLEKAKSNLNIFLTPKIIRTDAESRDLMTAKMAARTEYVKSVGGRDPFGSKLDQLIQTMEQKPEPTPEKTNEAPVPEAQNTTPSQP